MALGPLVYFQTNPKIYSAGLDILEMFQPQPDRLMTFWRTLQEVWLKLFGSRLATIAAINVSKNQHKGVYRHTLTAGIVMQFVLYLCCYIAPDKRGSVGCASDS